MKRTICDDDLRKITHCLQDPHLLRILSREMNEGTKVLMYAGIIVGSVFILGMFYKKVLGPMIAKRFPPSEGGGHGHGAGQGKVVNTQNPIH